MGNSSSVPPFPRVLLVFPVAIVSQSTPKRDQEGEIFIGVIGVTGGGKTTFISRATGRTDLEIGYGIDSCKSTETHRPSTTTVRTSADAELMKQALKMSCP